MRKLLIACIFCFGIFLVLASGSKPQYYTINTNNGQYTSVGKPEFQRDSKTYKFQNLDGKSVIVNKDDVQSIEEGAPTKSKPEAQPNKDAKSE